ncbi:MAG: hypothetical protein LBT51_10140 [Fusobacteriaceae bacterium]|jgi:hypothetical protein|nr:hypothetical protein [Fusobacteriaceae bacterium]
MDTATEVSKFTFDSTYIILCLGIIIALFFIFAFILKWILETNKTLDNLKRINKNFEENNELLKELIDDLNSKKERQSEQQKIEF